MDWYSYSAIFLKCLGNLESSAFIKPCSFAFKKSSASFSEAALCSKGLTSGFLPFGKTGFLDPLPNAFFGSVTTFPLIFKNLLGFFRHDANKR